MAVVRLDAALEPAILEALTGIPEITQVTMIDLGGLGESAPPRQEEL